MTRDADYHVLGLSPGASPTEVRQAYAALLQAWHPAQFTTNGELHGVAVRRVGEICNAYRDLCDAEQSGDLAGRGSAPPALTARGVVETALWSTLLVAIAYFGA